MKNLKALILVSSFLSLCACSNGSGGAGNFQGSLTNEEEVQSAFDSLDISGLVVQLKGELVANLSSSTPVTSSLGTVSQGTTLNPLVMPSGRSFLIYGNDGVFAAECESSPLDATFGPSHPLCQTAHVESYDTIVVCYANTSQADVMTAQAWPGSPMAFNTGRGMICYVDGVKMLSSHVFTY